MEVVRWRNGRSGGTRRRGRTRTWRAFTSAWLGVRAPTDAASSHKAAVASDDARISQLIHEASKGSKFYANQRAKHDAVTAKIERVRARRDEALGTISEAAHKHAAARVDQLAASLEAQRSLTRRILHCDMDMFYAAVELQRDPSLQGTCFAVGKGVLLTASYEARRRGVRSGMAEFVARAVCPELKVVPAHFDRYQESSEVIMGVLRKYDGSMVQRSLDEAYLDVTAYCEAHQLSAEDVATQLREDVRSTTQLTVSVGIAANMLLAKIASDRRKPNGQFAVPFERQGIMDFMASLPVRKVPGIGHVTERILDAFGIQTCGALWEERVMLSVCMDNFSFLLSAAMGISSSRVQPQAREARKSIGRENTFAPTADAKALDAKLRHACEQLAEDLVELGFRVRTVTLIGKRDTFERFSRGQSAAPHGIATADELYAIGHALLAQERAAAGGRLALRLLGIRGTALVDLRAESSQLQQWLQEGIVHTCPVCAKAIHVPSGTPDVQTSAIVNRHIDHCLGLAPERTPSREASPTKPAKRPRTLDAYFSTSNVQ